MEKHLGLENKEYQKKIKGFDVKSPYKIKTEPEKISKYRFKPESNIMEIK